MTQSMDGLSSRLATRISAADWADLISIGIPVRFLRGQILFHQGDGGRHVYVVLAGTVKIARMEAEAGQTILTLRTAGDVVGDLAALDYGSRSATVTALAGLTAQMVTAEQFRRFVDRPSVSSGYTRYTVERLRQADVHRSEIAQLQVRTRVARTLLRLMEPTAKSGSIASVRLAQHDIALFTGASRNAVVEELTELRNAGIVVTRRGTIGILDTAALHQIADF